MGPNISLGLCPQSIADKVESFFDESIIFQRKQLLNI